MHLWSNKQPSFRSISHTAERFITVSVKWSYLPAGVGIVLLLLEVPVWTEADRMSRERRSGNEWLIWGQRSHSSIISLTPVDTVSLELSFQISSGFSCVPSNMCTAASGLSRMASMKTAGKKRISVRRTCERQTHRWSSDTHNSDHQMH